MDKDDFALLKVIASSVETIREDIREMKQSLESKVDAKEFALIKSDVEDLKKKSWFAAGIAASISFAASHLFK